MASSPTEGSPDHKPAYAWFVVFALMLVYVVSLIDRQVLTLLVEPIKRDLDLSDTQISLLIGFAFAIFFTIMGVPIARLADRWSRRNVISIGIAFWSLATVACGFANSFWQLFAARVGVGVGESALTPSAYSMISDYFPPERLGRAIAVYVMGLYLGGGAALLLGSAVVGALSGVGAVALPIVGEIKPWQLVFIIVGAPGLLLALAFRLVVAEPRRRGVLESAHAAKESIEGRKSSGISGFLRLNSMMLGMLFSSFSCAGLVTMGLLAWVPEFLRRTYDWPIALAGSSYGACLLLFGSSGAWFGGWLCDRMTERGVKDAALRISMGAFIATGPCVVAMCFMPTGWLAIICLGLSTFAIATPQSLSPVVIQLITPNQFRAQVVAIYLFVANFIVIGLGPTLFALVTDFVFKDEAALRYSIALVCGVAIFGAATFITFAFRPFSTSYARAAVWRDTAAS